MKDSELVDSYANQNLDRNELFSLFKENEGVEYVEAVKKNIVSICLTSERSEGDEG